MDQSLIEIQRSDLPKFLDALVVEMASDGWHEKIVTIYAISFIFGKFNLWPPEQVLFEVKNVFFRKFIVKIRVAYNQTRLCVFEKSCVRVENQKKFQIPIYLKKTTYVLINIQQRLLGAYSRSFLNIFFLKLLVHIYKYIIYAKFFGTRFSVHSQFLDYNFNAQYIYLSFCRPITFL